MHKQLNIPLQITLSGILDVKDVKTHKFTFNNLSHEEGELDVNKIDNMAFIIGFSLIFDSVYDADFDFTPCITSQSTSEPFVEICLWQREIDQQQQIKYHWVILKHFCKFL